MTLQHEFCYCIHYALSLYSCNVYMLSVATSDSVELAICLISHSTLLTACVAVYKELVPVEEAVYKELMPVVEEVQTKAIGKRTCAQTWLKLRTTRES